ncbi:MAG TPA: glycosyltransferase [Acidimicrobiales bacterium]|nr:glycosyltransferase [Acidimicrobiales bacterium]
MSNSARLLVLTSDSLSGLVRKGEVTQRYHNPGDLFSEVHLITPEFSSDDLDRAAPMFGSARFHVHVLPTPRFVRTAGWRSSLIRPWLTRGVEIAAAVRPEVVRTHNNFLEGRLALEIKRQLGVPYVVSLHGVWDRDNLNTVKDRAISLARRRFERDSLSNADAVVAVYSPILRYARQLGARDPVLIYNAVSADIAAKTSYDLSEPPRILTVNRQVHDKNPEPILRAVAALDASYTLVGDGPLHPHLESLVRELGLEGRVELVRHMPNRDLCALLPTVDIVASHCTYLGISKTLIEGGLAGLPMIINDPPASSIEEYRGDWIDFCDGSEKGYREAIQHLLADHGARSRLGAAALAVARSRFDPTTMEAKLEKVYTDVLARRTSGRPDE